MPCKGFLSVLTTCSTSDFSGFGIVLAIERHEVETSKWPLLLITPRRRTQFSTGPATPGGLRSVETALPNREPPTKTGGHSALIESFAPTVKSLRLTHYPLLTPQHPLIRFMNHPPTYDIPNCLVRQTILPGNPPHALPGLDSRNNGSVALRVPGRRTMPDLIPRRRWAALLWSKCHLAPPPDQHHVLML